MMEPFGWFVIVCLAAMVGGQQFLRHAHRLWIHEAHELLLEHEALLRPTDPRQRMLRKP
jgi:hypothetical protein